MGADFKPCINDAVGIWLQCAADARAALAGHAVAVDDRTFAPTAAASESRRVLRRPSNMAHR